MTSTSRPPSATAGNARHLGPGSQTLDRGLHALEVLADAARPMSIAELAETLQIHRSNAYRLLRTLEARRFVLRDEAGLIRLGPRLAALGRGAAPRLTQIAHPELTALANTLGMTSFITVLDADEVITLLSVEPHHGHGSVAQRPGARHALGTGAPSHAIEASLTASEHKLLFGDQPPSQAAMNAKTQGYSLTQDEVIPGLTAVAVPLRIANEPPAALAVVTIGVPQQLPEVILALQQAAQSIAAHA